MWALQNEKPCLPATEVLSAFRQVAFLVTIASYGLVCFLDDVRGQKCDNLIIILHREVDECLNILFKYCLQKRIQYFVHA